VAQARTRRRRLYLCARERRDVGVATVLGFLCVLALMVIVTLLSYGVLPREQMGALKNPSMAGVLIAALIAFAGLVRSHFAA